MRKHGTMVGMGSKGRRWSTGGSFGVLRQRFSQSMLGVPSAKRVAGFARTIHSPLRFDRDRARSFGRLATSCASREYRETSSVQRTVGGQGTEVGNTNVSKGSFETRCINRLCRKILRVALDRGTNVSFSTEGDLLTYWSTCTTLDRSHRINRVFAVSALRRSYAFRPIEEKYVSRKRIIRASCGVASYEKDYSEQRPET